MTTSYKDLPADNVFPWLELLAVTTAERDALTAVAGMVVFNSTTATLQYYNGTIWV
jgi:hypothetical protein